MNERSIFIAALEMDDPDQRQAYLAKACGTDPQMRERLESLLAAHQAGGGVLDRPLVKDEATSPFRKTADGSGLVIAGRYKLLEEIAEGGMGSVWVAQQTEPVRRRVALKLIKPGMDTRQVLSRFEVERQALAMMDHPNIAKVLDGGVTEQGRPFFAMEYVKGVPITEFCDQAKLTVEVRLKLFMQVCQAVQHAHQKGIIHRDLKPSNILVCLYDGQPVPKVIDFGLAKAMHQPLTERTLYTGHGLMVGTPLYMSPEQAELNNLDIDTRTDVYALGVILYEMLTGTTPLDRLRFKDAAWQEIVRLIKEDEPSKPSTKLSGSGSLPSIAAQRSLEPAQLSRLVRGDLDWIVMKSLEKERSRRYETANSLAKDIERYLNDEPVEACPPSSTYRFRKFARRNRAALVTALLVSSALVFGIIVSTWEAVRATQAESLAETARENEAAQRKIAEDQKKVAENERAAAVGQRAQAEANFQKARTAVDEYFTLVSESKLFDVPGLEPLRKDLLEAALKFYQGFADERTNDPAVLADLASTWMRIAEINHTMDRNDAAVAAVDRAMRVIDRLRREFPNAKQQHRKLAGYWKGLRTREDGTAMPADPQAAFRSIQRLAETWRALAQENPEELAFQSDLASLYFHIGELLIGDGHEAEGIEHFEKSKTTLEQLEHAAPRKPEYRADLARTMQRLASRLKSESFARKALSLCEQLVVELPRVPQSRADLAFSLNQVGNMAASRDPVEAEKAFRRAIEVAEALVTESPATPVYWKRLDDSHRLLIALLTRVGKPGEAEEVERRRALFTASAGARTTQSPATLESIRADRLYDSGVQLYRTGKIGDGEKAMRQVIAILENVVADPNCRPSSRAKLGHAYRYVGGTENRRKAVDVFAKLVADQPGDDHRQFLAATLCDLGLDLTKAGKLDEAEPFFRRSIDVEGKFPSSHTGLAEVLAQQNHLTEALVEARTGASLAPRDFVALERLLDVLNRIGDSENTLVVLRERVEATPTSTVAHYHLGTALRQQGRDDEAIAEYRRTIELDSNWEWSRLALAEVLLKQHKQDEALAETRKINVPDNAIPWVHFQLGQLLARQGQSNDAFEHLLKAVGMEPENSTYFQAIGNVVSDRAGNSDQAAMIERAEAALAKTPSYVDWCAIRGRWTEAAAGIEKRIENKPDDHFPRFQEAFVLAMQGDVEKYRQHCRQMLDKFGDTQDPNIAERVAKACLILPPPPDQLKELRDLAERAVTKGANSRNLRYFQLAHALADYRAGEFGTASEWIIRCGQSEKPLGAYGVGMANLLGAMIQARLGNKEKAAGEWTRAAQFCDGLPQVQHGQLLYPADWHDGIAVELLRREAEQLFQRRAPSDATMRKPENASP
jgi:eukaryotic-like serine/threonine-protein kinase